MTKHVYNELLTVAETCRYLKITPRTLYRYIQAHRLPGFKLGKEWRFVRTDLETWLKERPRAAQSRSIEGASDVRR